MICHRDRTFCASSGHCANRDCDLWIDMGKDYDLPLSLAEYQDKEVCPGYEPCAVLKSIQQIVTGE